MTAPHAHIFVHVTASRARARGDVTRTYTLYKYAPRAQDKNTYSNESVNPISHGREENLGTMGGADSAQLYLSSKNDYFGLYFGILTIPPLTYIQFGAACLF